MMDHASRTQLLHIAQTDSAGVHAQIRLCSVNLHDLQPVSCSSQKVLSKPSELTCAGEDLAPMQEDS